MNEGVRYKVNEISILSEIKGVDINELRQLVSFDDDAWYDARLLEQGLLDISKSLGSFGYAFVNLTPDIKTNAETAMLDIDITIEKARRNFVERIEFVDNSRTTDRVIRREFEIVEGDASQPVKNRPLNSECQDLGYFSEVKVQTLKGSTPEQSVTSVTVREQPTGDFSIGVGYSSLAQANFTLGINERNFLGTGRRLKMAFSTAGDDTDFSIGLTEPYFMGRDLSGSFDIFSRKDTSGDSTVNETGLSFGVGFAAARDVYHRLRYDLSKSKTSVSSTTATSETGEEGKSLHGSSVAYTLSKDLRDSRFDPTEGYFLELDETVSGLGGDVKFLRTKLSAGLLQATPIQIGYCGAFRRSWSHQWSW